jgi:trehalose 2-sulfotransferase
VTIPSADAIARLNEHYRSVFQTADAKSFDPAHLLARRPLKNYLICFGERSGSTMLISLLRKTNVMGRPDEFINPRGVMQRYVGLCGARDIDGYFSYLRAQWSTSNGVFGMKTAFLDFAPVLNEDLVDYLLSPVHYIYLTRQDILRQAVSLALAKATGIWYASAKAGPPVATTEPDLDEKLVLGMIDKLKRDRDNWERFFASRNVDPLRITYEELVQNPSDVIMSIASYVDVELDPAAIPVESEYRQQANTTNEKWVNAMRDSHPTQSW